MKLLRCGNVGKEVPAVLDENGIIRDLSTIISDLTPNTITSTQQYDVIDMLSGNGGGDSTDGYYSSYNPGNQTWTQHDVLNRQLLRQTYFDNGNLWDC